MNHSSQLDGFMFAATVPSKYIATMRTMAKAGLFKVPLFGTIMKDIGHFPVYFKSTEQGSFSVDKEKQMGVMEEVDAHLKSGGAVTLYPEGQINRTNARQLQTFRRGSLKMARSHNMQMWGFVVTDMDTAWPNDKGAQGGHPATLFYRLFRIDDPEEEDLAAYCLDVEKQMQAELDDVYAIRDAALGAKNKDD